MLILRRESLWESERNKNELSNLSQVALSLHCTTWIHSSFWECVRFVLSMQRKNFRPSLEHMWNSREFSPNFDSNAEIWMELCWRGEKAMCTRIVFNSYSRKMATKCEDMSRSTSCFLPLSLSFSRSLFLACFHLQQQQQWWHNRKILSNYVHNLI